MVNITKLRVECNKCNQEFDIKATNRDEFSFGYGQIIVDISNDDGGEACYCPHCGHFIA